MPRMPTRRVLIVDSDTRRATATAAALPKAFTADFAEGGSDALSVLAASPCPDAVVIERDLPDLDGFALARRIREAPHETRTVVLAASATESVPVGIREHCDAYFVEDEGEARGVVAGLALSLLPAA